MRIIICGIYAISGMAHLLHIGTTLMLLVQAVPIRHLPFAGTGREIRHDQDYV